MKNSLEKDIDRLFAADRPPTLEECARTVAKHMKKLKDAPAVLRRLADYIEQMPEPVELSAKAIAGLIEIGFVKEG